MQRRALSVLAVAGCVTVVVAGAGLSFSRVEPGHKPMHIGCSHHNHGPKWHADHGRILGLPRGGTTRSPMPSADDLKSRSLVADRTGPNTSAAED